jgi:hypothetical protein
LLPFHLAAFAETRQQLHHPGQRRSKINAAPLGSSRTLHQYSRYHHILGIFFSDVEHTGLPSFYQTLSSLEK